MENGKNGFGVLKKVLRAKELSAILPLLFLAIVAAIVNPSFLKLTNILDMLRATSFTFIVAVPITFLMSSGRMDLSVGATITMGGVIAAMADTAGLPLWLSLLLGLLTGCLIGAINGLIIVYCNMPAFIATMGTQYTINGLVSIITENTAVLGISEGFTALGQTRLLGGLSITVLYALVIGIVGHIILTRSKYGRELLAVGGNIETAFLSGINPKRKHMQMYIVSGMFAALTGILYAARFSSAQLGAGSGTELTTIAAIIIGGTSLGGGSGTVLGSALGCMLFAAINNALIVMQISAFWQKVVIGMILILALFIDRYRRRRIEGK